MPYINKEKILAGVRACINPHITICQECPYWNNGDKQCEELKKDIAEVVRMVQVYEISTQDWSGLQEGL
jgi:hypothetical protein